MPWPMRFGPLPRMITFGRVAARHLVALVVGRVEVRGARRELGGAGVDRVVDGADAEGVAQRADLVGRQDAQLGDGGVGEPGGLRRPQQPLVEFGGARNRSGYAP